MAYHEYGATFMVKVADVNYRRSPLVQGSLEILIEVSIVRPYSDVHNQALEIYRTSISEHHEERKAIDGNFKDVTAAILAGIKTQKQRLYSHA